MRTPEFSLVLLCILSINIEDTRAAVPATKDGLNDGPEYQVEERQQDQAVEKQLLEELIRAIEEKTFKTGQGESKDYAPQDPDYTPQDPGISPREPDTRSQGSGYGTADRGFGQHDPNVDSQGTGYGTQDTDPRGTSHDSTGSNYDPQESGYGPRGTGLDQSGSKDSGYGSQGKGFDISDSAYQPNIVDGPSETDESDVTAQLSVLLRSLEQELDGMQSNDGLKTGLSDINEDPTLRALDDDAIANEIEGNKTAEHIDEQLQRVRKKIINKVLSKIAKKVFKKTILKVQVKLLKLTSRVLLKIAKKTGMNLLARLGLKAGKKAAVKAATLLATKLGTSVSTSASSGPGFPFVFAIQLAFDILSIGLDLGDAGGYCKMGTLAEYKEMKAGIDKELKKELETEGGEFPGVVGPLDKLTDSEYEALLNATINEMLKPENGNPILEKILSKLESDITSNQLTEADADDDVKIDLYAKLVESDDIYDIVCTELKGKVVDTGNGDKQCSYKDRETCDSSYSWPLAEDSNEIYGEYKTEVYGGACVTASYALRSICYGNSLPYDSETGLCTINETYCKMKGAEWGYNEDIKEYDCVISKGQSFAEMIFGKTIVRGLKQIFDLDQYEKCKSGEIDDGYFCRSIFCSEGEEQWANAGICYPKCKQGFHPFGCCICSPDCAKGWTDDGATCRRAGYCDPDKEHDGALCYDQCKSPRDNGVGPVCWVPCPEGYKDIGLLCSKGGEVYPKKSRPANKKPCPDGMRDDGTSCWKDTYGRGAGRIPGKKTCPSGMRDDGTSCWRDTYGRGAGRIPDKAPCPSGLRDDGTSCWRDAHIYGKGCCCTIWGCCNKCKSGYHDDGCTCRRTGVGIKVTLFARQRCRSHEEKCGALCYPKCKSGYHKAGCNLCAPNEGAGIKVTLGQRYSCKSNEELHGALCYPKCKANYRPKGCCLCEPNEGPGIKVTLFQRQYCNANEKNVAGICWSPCASGQVDDGALCRVPLHTITQKSYGRGVGTPDTVIKGKSASYGRGVGKPAVHIRAKKRIIPFSTKNNK